VSGAGSKSPRYRIVTDGAMFKVQGRGLWSWHDLQHGPWQLVPYEPFRIGRVHHDTLESARKHLGELVAADERINRGWQTVETR
jgi:hypothetical protein